MSDNNPFLLVLILAIAALGFAVGPLVAAYAWAKFFSPRKPGQEKNATYECGLEAKGDAWIQFKSEYYLYGIIFLVFDVETIFLLPFAVSFTGLGVGAFHDRAQAEVAVTFKSCRGVRDRRQAADSVVQAAGVIVVQRSAIRVGHRREPSQWIANRA